MTEALRRYKMILIILVLTLLIAFLTFAIIMQKPDKVPSKGIFVFEDANRASPVKVMSEQRV
ncbi:hypothetical protein [Acetivibrio mesophilus]|uniref:Uncharacterized protein n=1 Tax=Acetivibrio mesophilus TaxID=2487273 RepID=A0A4Q0I4J3_9FIRM|nr:hypothetical protein [Acetivibrio mesophilus]ODM26032.1 hypothetical protein A7W90_07210 [Clostridium sp. Bc-iso-3]RXE59171.1 hypothetical protein EFD62_08475 [Acetivibrio mesophilus]HHV29183.1 hypothetical protein [Clostridium sp.]